MKTIIIGRVKVRPSVRRREKDVSWGREVTIPSTAARILGIDAGDELECIVDVERGLLIYRRVGGDG